jgi:hypothetical protein
MILKHNKKRNSGMLAEFFSAFIAESIILKRHDRVSASKDLWNKYTKKGTELRKELAIFSAIQNRSFESREVAWSFLRETIRDNLVSKKLINQEILEQEKTSLIRELGSLGLNQNNKFFDRDIPDYKNLATVQILINNYLDKSNSSNGNSGSPALLENILNPAVAELEDRVLKLMMTTTTTTDKKTAAVQSQQLNSAGAALNLKEAEVDGLVVRLMREKLNKKFSRVLTESQKDIVQRYVFGKDLPYLSSYLKNLNRETIELVSDELARKQKNSNSSSSTAIQQIKKLTETKTMLEEKGNLFGKPTAVAVLDDEAIVFYMAVAKLNEELKSKENVGNNVGDREAIATK